MKNAKNLVIAILLLFLLCSSSFILHNNVENNASNSIIQEINSPEVSNPNKSLLHTYDFEDETIGQDPTYQTLSVNEATGCTANIETLADGQQKHLSLHKVGSTGRVWVRDNFSRFGETYTAGEYHLKVYHDASGFGINLNSANMEAILAMVWWNGEIRDDVGGTLLATYAYNQWLDVVIYFNLSLGWMFDLEGVRYGAGYSYSFFGPFTANAEHIWITSFVSGGGDGYFRVDDISFYYETENLINIFTPESKEYRKPMDGYYPSTYGFENDADGTSPEGWINQDWSSCTSEIISELGGHKKVLRQTDNSNGYGAVVNRTFASAQDHGTVEFYARVSLITPGTRMWLDLNSASGQEIWLIMDDSGIKFWDGGPWYDIIPSGIKANTWYHFSIRWRNTGASSYEALGEGEWKIFIDGVEYGNYDLVYDDIMNSVNLESGASPFGHITYWDAIGFDWDPNYNIGDNLYEGLLLSFKNSTALDWIGYSLDGQLNKTILGNTTIPMPEDGLHSIQVFGNDSLGDMYQSDIRHFTVDFPIDIITPEAKIYEKGMSGYYPATYGFENDRPGESPDDWILNVMDGSSFVAVDSNLDGHNNVVEIRKDGGINSAGMSNNFDLNVSIGAVEFWLYKDTDSGTDATFFSVVSTENFNGNAQGVIMDGDFYYMTSDFGSRILVASDIFSINTWHHVSLEFNISIGWQITIDDILYGQNYAFPFRGSVTGNQMKSFFVQSLFSGGASNYGSWVDSVGYSWDPCYTIRDNLNEGLLLSYENSTNLDWQGYSLDGQPINTIMGNTTIPLPEDGSHFIRVFGNDSLGTIYQSNIRHFSVYSINIITPEEKLYTVPMDGYYPATYGFESDLPGADAKNWTHVVLGGTHSYIVDSYHGHERVYEMFDNAAGNPDTYTNFNNQLSGTVEAWVLVSLSDYVIYLDINQGTSPVVRLVLVTGANLIALNNSVSVNMTEFGIIQEDQWYHIRVDFRSALAGSYMGLAADSYRIYLNGVQCNSDLLVNVPSAQINRVTFLTGWTAADPNYYAYFDAVGFSWDPYYTVGDNLYEGLLISYKNSTSLEWQGYSLDGQPINTIMGNNTIPLPNDGEHTIQIFANNSLGTKYLSDIRNFAISRTIQIITPENKVYTEPMSGYYPATFGFEETITGILPSYCDYAPGGSSPDGPGSYAKVIDNWTDGAGNTHKKVLKTYDRTSSSTTHASLYFTDEGSENYRNSTIEFWACNTLTGSYYHSYFEIWGDLGNMVSFEWDSGGTTNDPEVRITPATGEFGTGVYHEWNRWYRYSIDISCDGGYAGLGTNQFRFRIYNETGDLIYSSADLDLLTAHPTGGPYRYHVLSTESQSDVSHYLDGFGITGLQDNYNISDNFEEGLLLSYENSTSLDWQGYSLDGQPINFIMGNIAIPLPDVGQHTIQVFGEDLLGKMHKSDIRYFMVDTTQVVDILAPSITINSPENNTFWNSAPFLDITAIDPNLDTIWYSVNNVNITLQNNTLQQLNISIWNTLPEEGEFVIYIYANDSTGNLNDEYMLRLHKDVKNPAVIINNPNPSDLFGDLSPTFDISISEPNLNQTWYTLIGGSLNHFFSGSSGTIDQTSWEEFGNGTVTIRFYANDTLNNLGFSEVTVRKDTIEPQITINNPIQDQVFYDTAPSFDLTIIEGNLDSIWYTLDDGITYFPCDISGIFNNLYWNAIPPGYYTLKFYANDTLGNLGFSEVIIEKKEPVIPGYNPLLVSLIIVVGIMGISLKIKKKSK